MSMSAYVHCHTCGETLNYGHDSLPGGLQGLFEALGVPVKDWSGKTGVEVLPNLHGAIQRLSDPYEKCDLKEKHDTRMGTDGEWSRVDFALPFLTAMRDAICRDPYATLSVS